MTISLHHTLVLVITVEGCNTDFSNLHAMPLSPSVCRRRRLNGFTSEIASLSFNVCGSDLFFVSGKKKLAKPPKINRTPITINGNTIISLPM